jgi:hypothetical protein
MKIEIKSRTLAAVKFGVIVLLVLSFSCNSKDKRAEFELEKLHWLIGSWQQVSEAGTLTETWSKKGRGLSGKSYLLDGGDTVFSESLNLEIRNGAVFYVPVISDQNKGRETLFKLVSNSNDRFVFENKAHDFPQRIIYRKLPGDSLLARIEGEVKGKLKFEEFKMKRLR